MNETIYLLFNASVLPVWAALILVPYSRFTERLITTPLVPLLYAVAYLVLFALGLGGGEGGMGSLADLRVAFERDVILLMAWVHYLCFDMAVGMAIVRDARRHEVSAWSLAPCLVLTLMLGPSGLLLYCGLRLWKVGHLRMD